MTAAIQVPEKTVALVGELRQSPLVYNGVPVITLAAVDAIHEREPGSTSQNFARYKDVELLPGKHYFEALYPVWSQWVNDTLSERVSFLPDISGRGGRRGDLILLTERGYLRLIMHFED